MIDAKEVNDIMLDSLYKEDELDQNGKPFLSPIEVEGVVAHVGFHPERVKRHMPQIKEWLKELPVAFHEESGGGWSFLQGCMTRDDHQWGEQVNVEQLMMLGIAVGLVRYTLPRDMWSMLPGGVPYFAILKEVNNE